MFTKKKPRYNLSNNSKFKKKYFSGNKNDKSDYLM